MQNGFLQSLGDVPAWDITIKYQWELRAEYIVATLNRHQVNKMI